MLANAHVVMANAHVAMEDVDRRALEAIWRERLVNARTRYEAAKTAVQGAREAQLSSPDDSLALDHTLRAEHHTFAEFKRVLTIFYDLLVYGKAPADCSQ